MEDFRRDEVSSKAKNRSCRSATIKRTITVHASSEIACPPDLCSLTISVSSTKETAEAAQNSVKRRGEYIMQVLRNNSIKERLVRKSTDVNRVSEDEVCVQTSLLVQTDSLQACEAARNLVIEKMDATVQCSTICLHHSPESKAEGRQQAFKVAVSNAKQKALGVAQMLDVRLGPALEVVETSQQEHREAGPPTGSDPSCEDGPHHCSTARLTVSRQTDSASSLHASSANLHERLRGSTVVYETRVEVTFEAFPLRACHHRKCPKH